MQTKRKHRSRYCFPNPWPWRHSSSFLSTSIALAASLAATVAATAQQGNGDWAVEVATGVAHPNAVKSRNPVRLDENCGVSSLVFTAVRSEQGDVPARGQLTESAAACGFENAALPGCREADDIDLEDFQDFLGCMTGPDSPAPPSCACNDYDDDGMVDLFDFADLAAHYTGSIPCEGEVPVLEYCTPVCDWEASWAVYEEQVIALVNEHRSEGAVCGGDHLAGVDELELNPHLRCAARAHSLDMAERGFFAHVNPDGVDPGDRLNRAGYSWWTYGENIARGQPPPASVVAAWMASSGHCRNIMRSAYSVIGVGYHPTRHHWTLVFAGP